MFNMDFKSDGISWVGNIYQKFEAICQEVDGIMIQEKAKYLESQMQTGCDNVRKFCAEVMQDLLLPAAACDVKGPASDLSLVYDVDVGMCKKSKVGSPIEEKTSTPAELDVFVSSGKGSSPPLLAGHYNLNEGEDRGAPSKESIRISEPVNRCDCLEKAGEYNNYHSDACLAVSSALPPNSSPSTDSVGICKSHEPMLLPSVVSLDKGHDLQNKSDALDFVLPSSEIGYLKELAKLEKQKDIRPSIVTDAFMKIRASHLSDDCHYKCELLRGVMKIRGHEQVGTEDQCNRGQLLEHLFVFHKNIVLTLFWMLHFYLN